MNCRTMVLMLWVPVLAIGDGDWAQAQKETAVGAAERHQRVAARRSGVHIVCHRGAVEFAHENTMEAYRAAFELGADGNEIDIRATKDGILVCFHDDMVDHLLNAYGDVSDYTWDELQKLPFRNPGRFGKYCRIPTLQEVFELHRQHAGLMQLDVKRPGLVEPISRLLDALDMWDHVVLAPTDFADRRIQRTRGKAGLYLDRGEVDAIAIAAALQKPGGRIILEDPRGVALALGRTITTPSDEPVNEEIAVWAKDPAVAQTEDERSLQELLLVLRDADDWKVVARGAESEAASADKILQRAFAADELSDRGARSPAVYTALEERVRNRSLHRNWRYCGLDGSVALRALIRLKAPQSVDVARFCLWRDDPAVEAARNPEFNSPRSWTDWRTKITVFRLLESIPGERTEQLCRDYLALSDEAAREIGVLQFEPAARTLLTISPTATTAKELLGHRLSVVRGRVILFCLAHAEQDWARNVLEHNAPHALNYLAFTPSADSATTARESPKAD